MTLTTLGYPRAPTLKKLDTPICDYDTPSKVFNPPSHRHQHSQNLTSYQINDPGFLSQNSEQSRPVHHHDRIILDDQLARQLGIIRSFDEDLVRKPPPQPIDSITDHNHPSREGRDLKPRDYNSSSGRPQKENGDRKNWLYSSNGLSQSQSRHIHPTPLIQRPSQSQFNSTSSSVHSTRNPLGKSQPSNNYPQLEQSITNHISNSSTTATNTERKLLSTTKASSPKFRQSHPQSSQTASSASDSSSNLTNDSSSDQSLQRNISAAPSPPRHSRIPQPVPEFSNRFAPTPSNRRMGFSEDAAKEVIPSHLESTSQIDLSSSQHTLEPLLQLSLIAVESIWPHHSSPPPSASQTPSEGSRHKSSHPPIHFVSEVLRRSRTNSNTLKIALFYIHQSRRAIRERIAIGDRSRVMYQQYMNENSSHHSNSATDPFLSSAAPIGSDRTRSHQGTMSKSELDRLVRATRDPMLSGKKTFLAALMCASKYLQDRNFSNRAWAKISSLPIQDVNYNERVFLEMIDYRLHVEVEAFDIWSLRLRKLMDERTTNVDGESASKEPPPPTNPQSLPTSAGHSPSTKISGTRESLPNSQASSCPSIPRRPTISRPVDCLSSSPSVVRQTRENDGAGSSNPIAKHDLEFKTPARQQSHNLAPRGNLSNLSAPHLSSLTSGGPADQRPSSSIPHRQMTTPLISRPKGYSASRYSSSRPEPSTFDTPTKVGGAPVLAGLNRTLTGASLIHPSGSGGSGRYIANSERILANEPIHVARALKEPTRGMSSENLGNLTSGAETRKVTAEDVIRAERELLEKIAREKNLLERDGLSSKPTNKDATGLNSEQMTHSPEGLNNNPKGEIEKLAEERRMKDEFKKEQVRKLVELKRNQELGRRIKSETLGHEEPRDFGSDLDKGVGREFERVIYETNKNIGESCLNDCLDGYAHLNNKNILYSGRRASDGFRSDRVTSSSIMMATSSEDRPSDSRGNIRYPDSRIRGLDELAMGYPLPRAGMANAIEEDTKIRAMMDRRAMNSCGMQESSKFQDEISTINGPTRVSSSVTGVDEILRGGRKILDGPPIEDHRRDRHHHQAIYGDHYHSLNHLRVGGRPIY